ncbi:endonuclease domain-containing protein [Arthrobacter sp. R4]|uniref:endonuclease domain-containing protein n=1 Tax=Micrococcaceae TaxID=1268 RepID=UPI003076EA81
MCRTAEADTCERLLLDHCHVTGKVRLLCRNCNAGLARFKDSPAILGNAHAYIANALWDVGHDLTDIKQYLRRS